MKIVKTKIGKGYKEEAFNEKGVLMGVTYYGITFNEAVVIGN